MGNYFFTYIKLLDFTHKIFLNKFQKRLQKISFLELIEPRVTVLGTWTGGSMKKIFQRKIELFKKKLIKKV